MVRFFINTMSSCSLVFAVNYCKDNNVPYEILAIGWAIMCQLYLTRHEIEIDRRQE